MRSLFSFLLGVGPIRRYFNTVIDSAGNPISGATVTVKHRGTATSATLYSDEGITTTPNPVTTDSRGFFAFYIHDGDYDFDILKTGVISVTITDISIVDPKRVFQLALNDDAWLLMNAEYNRATAAWNRIDTGKVALAIGLDRVADAIKFYRKAAGANPITTWDILQTMDSGGRMIPGHILDRTATQVAADNITTETTLYSYPISGNLLTTTRGVRLVIFGQRSNNNVANNPTILVKYGATTLISVANDPNSPAGTLLDYVLEVYLFNANATNSQKAIARMTLDDVSVGSVLEGAWVKYGTSAIDSTLAQTLLVSVQWATANANNRWRKEMAFLEFIP